MRPRSSPPSSRNLDWQAIVGLLAERSDKPLVLMDRSARIRLFSGGMEQALGWRRHEVESRAWTDALVPGDALDSARRWLAQALRGALARYECEVLARDGRRLVILFDMALVGRGPQQGLLLTVQEVSPAVERTEVLDQELDYRVTATATDFGKVEEVVQAGYATGVAPGPERRCFALLQQRDTPCPDCPVLRSPDEPWPRTTVRRRASGEGSFQIVTAHALSKTSVHMSVRLISDASLGAIHEARISALAEKARLTGRERDILRYLLLGRSLDDIASMLELSRRTVKFHQGNLLQKLGADSRTDLIRLIGF